MEGTWPPEAITVAVILGIAVVLALGGIIWLLSSAQKLAEEKLNRWKEQDVAVIRQTEARAANLEAKNELEVWKQDYAMAIRQDAIARSQSVIMGKITEHLVPYFPSFPFNPKDARFIGSPIDLLVFEGLDEGELKEIVFVEVKAGSSRTTSRQRQIRDAITTGRVVWRELRVDSPI